MTTLAPELLALAALGDTAKQAWTRAAKEGVGYLLLLKKNNPKVPLRSILARPDAKQALRAAGTQAATAVQRSILAGWLSNGGSADSVFLKRLLLDSKRNGQAFERLAASLLRSPDGSDLRGLVSGYALRQAAGVAVAISRAKGEQVLHAAGKGREVEWRTTSDQPCPECLALHGKRVTVGKEFPHRAGGRTLKVYVNLICPPRHPFCRCILFPI